MLSIDISSYNLTRADHKDRLSSVTSGEALFHKQIQAMLVTATCRSSLLIEHHDFTSLVAVKSSSERCSCASISNITTGRHRTEIVVGKCSYDSCAARQYGQLFESLKCST